MGLQLEYNVQGGRQHQHLHIENARQDAYPTHLGTLGVPGQGVLHPVR